MNRCEPICVSTSQIAQASANRTLIDMLSMLSDWTLLIMQYSLPSQRPVRVEDATHDRILKAIRAGDKELAASTMRKHLVVGKGILLEELADNQSPVALDDQSVYADVWRV
jgi:DNA-binding FadR family transcriptional regulator